MHKRCKKRNKDFPLVSYMVPIREEQKILHPSFLKIRIISEEIYRIEGIGDILSEK